MSNSSNKGYQFTINATNGAVTAVYKIENGRTQYERIDSDEFYTYDAQTNTVTKTEWDDGRQEVTTYTDANQDGIFLKGGEGYAQSGGNVPAPGPIVQNGYQFERDANGSVTAVYEVEHGQTQRETINANETFTYDATSHTVTKTEVERGLTETVVYADADGDGTFQKISKTYTGTTNTGSAMTWDASHHGSDNDDQYNGGRNNDYYAGGLGNDVLRGNNGDDDLYGAEGDDDLFGGTGADELFGGEGNDDFFAGLGKDVLTGGSGNDVYKYYATSEVGLTLGTRDVITDFAAGDTIDLSAIDAQIGNRTNDAFQFIGSSANLNLGNANGALWFDNGVVYGSTDRDLAAEFQLELTGVTSVSAADFVL